MDTHRITLTRDYKGPTRDGKWTLRFVLGFQDEAERDLWTFSSATLLKGSLKISGMPRCVSVTEDGRALPGLGWDTTLGSEEDALDCANSLTQEWKEAAQKIWSNEV